MKNAKFWIYPLSVYLAAAALFSIGCADDNKNKRMPIKPSQNQNKGGGTRDTGSGDNTDDPKTIKEVKTIFDNSTDKAIAATGKATASEIEEKSKSGLVGVAIAADSIEEGNYEIKSVSLSGEIATKQGGFMVHMLSEISDRNNLQNAKNTFSSTAKSEEEKKEAASTEKESAKNRTKTGNDRKNRGKTSAADLEQRRRDRENGKLKKANADKKDNAALNATAAKVFVYNYGFGRQLKFTNANGIEEVGPVQINAYMKPGAREMKVGYSDLGSGAVNDVKAISIGQLLAKSQLKNGDNSYDCKTADKCILSFRQDKNTLQVTIREEHNSEGGVSATKIITITYAKTSGGKKNNKEEKTPETSPTPYEGHSQFIIPKDEFVA